MFEQNKYTEVYYKIIDRAKNRVLVNQYTENHHIIPKSMGGKRTRDNEVKLTAKEHYICHLLLIRMVSSRKDKRKMCFALHGMRRSRTGKRYNSGLYERSRIRISELISGKNNPSYGKKYYGSDNPFYGKTHTKEAKEKMSAAQKRKTGPKNSFYGKKHTEKTKKTLGQIKSKPIRVTFTDGKIIKLPSQKSLGTYLGKSEHLGLKLNKVQFSHLWEKYNILRIENEDV